MLRLSSLRFSRRPQQPSSAGSRSQTQGNEPSLNFETKGVRGGGGRKEEEEDEDESTCFTSLTIISVHSLPFLEQKAMQPPLPPTPLCLPPSHRHHHRTATPRTRSPSFVFLSFFFSCSWSASLRGFCGDIFSLPSLVWLSERLGCFVCYSLCLFCCEIVFYRDIYFPIKHTVVLLLEAKETTFFLGGGEKKGAGMVGKGGVGKGKVCLCG